MRYIVFLDDDLGKTLLVEGVNEIVSEEREITFYDKKANILCIVNKTDYKAIQQEAE